MSAASSGIDVSVIVAVKNGADTLQQCIESILSQRSCSVELIIVDGMSTDSTSDIVEAYGKRIAHSIREPDLGIYDAWNKALAVASGQWCAFLGSDDYFIRDDALSALLQSGEQSMRDPVFVYGGVVRVGGNADYVIHPRPADAVRFLRSGRMLPHPGSLHRAEALRAIGGFDPSYRIVGDFVAVLRLSSVGEMVRCTELVIATRIGGISGRRDMLSLSAKEKFRALRQNVGILSALRRHIGFRWPQRVARAGEAAALAVLGTERGTALLIDLRRRLDRPQKLI